jgi:hypothetical protein
MRTPTKVKAAAKPATDFALVATIWFFGLLPVVLGISLAVAQAMHLVSY